VTAERNHQLLKLEDAEIALSAGECELLEQPATANGAQLLWASSLPFAAIIERYRSVANENYVAQGFAAGILTA